MDPNAALATARQLVGEMRAWLDGDDDPDEPGEYYRIASELAQVVGDLDEWITKGGFLPKGWEGPLTVTMAGNWTDNVRAVHRLETAFDRAIRDDERADRALTGEAAGSGLRAHLVRLLAREVIEEVNRERAKIEEMINSAVTRQFMDSAAQRLAESDPASFTLRDGVFPVPEGMTAHGWAKLQGIREARGAGNDE